MKRPDEQLLIDFKAFYKLDSDFSAASRLRQSIWRENKKMTSGKYGNYGGRSVKEVAQDLGIEANVLYRWKRELSREKGEAFPGKGRLAPQEEELRRLRRELERVKEYREI